MLERSWTCTLVSTLASLDEASTAIVVDSPRILVVDKAFGSSEVLKWMSRIPAHTIVIVWGASLTEGEAIRFLKAGARGVLHKSSGVESVIACIESVAQGGTWLDRSVVRDCSRGDIRPHTELTPREQQVLECVEQGLRNKEIAYELDIRPGTVKIHLKHIFEKTGVRGRYGLAISGLKAKGMVSQSQAC